MTLVNYRGITVVVILAKLYAMVLESRATAWAEDRKCRAKGQAGFRKGLSYDRSAFHYWHNTATGQALQA